MTVLFTVFATGMLLVALVCIALPLWRAARAPAGPSPSRQLQALRQALDAGVISADEYTAKRALLDTAVPPPTPASDRSRLAFSSLLAVLLVLPLASLGLYRLLGEPRALDPTQAIADSGAPADHGPEMEKAITGLVDKLKQNPDDVEGWMLLGRAYKSQQRFVEARDTLKNALDRAKDNPDVLVEYAEALALASESHQLAGEPRALLEKAIGIEPAHQRALWLLGIAEYQDGHVDEAIARWDALKAALPPDSEVRRSVESQIAQAKAKAGMPTDAPATVAATPPPAAPVSADGPKITVKVSLSPALAAKVSADDALFVFAKAAGGPPMPLAVKRLRAGDLPTTVVLTDGMGMMPTMKLSQFPQVILGARISKSGNAIPQSGDMQTQSGAMAVTTTEAVVLTIDQVVP